jgi:hypothetical protein
MSVQVRGDLIKSGFVANNEKSVWNTVQSIEWLGFIWNLSSILYFLHENTKI